MSEFIVIQESDVDLRRHIAELRVLGASGKVDPGEVLVALIPTYGLSEYEGFAFPAQTREFFRFLSREAPDGLAVAIAAPHEEYPELAQHSALWTLPIQLIIQPHLVAVTVNLVSSFIYERMRSLLPGQRAEVDSELLLKKGDDLLSICYRGPAESYENVMKEAIERMTCE